MVFIESTDHRPTDPPTTFHLPTDPTTGRDQLSQNRRPDSTYVLQSQILQNIFYQLVHVIS